MLSDAANGTYRRNLRAGGGSGGLAMLAQRGNFLGQRVAPNVVARNASRSMNSQAYRGLSPIAQLGQALKRAGQPMQAPQGNMAPRTPYPPIRRQVRRTTPFL